MRSLVEVSIDGFDYKLTQLGGKDAYRLSIVLAGKLAGGLDVLDSLLKAKSTQDFMKSNDLAVMGQAVRGIFERLPTDEAMGITEKLFAPCSVVINGAMQGLNQAFDEHFAGRTPSAYKVLWAVLKANYGNFLQGLGGVGTGASTQTASPSAT